MATAEEMEIARCIRREFAKRPIDATRLEIAVIRGRVYLSGTLVPIREEVGTIVKEEVQHVLDIVTKMNGVKQVIMECRIREDKPKETPGHHKHSHGTGHR